MKAGRVESFDWPSDLIDRAAEAIAESKVLRGASAQLRKEARRILDESRRVVVAVRQQRSASRSLLEN
jgi:hypothetical protein